MRGVTNADGISPISSGMGPFNGMYIQKVIYDKEIIYTCIDQVPTAVDNVIIDNVPNPIYREFVPVYSSDVTKPIVGYAYVESGTNNIRVYVWNPGLYTHFSLKVLTNGGGGV